MILGHHRHVRQSPYFEELCVCMFVCMFICMSVCLCVCVDVCDDWSFSGCGPIFVVPPLKRCLLRLPLVPLPIFRPRLLTPYCERSGVDTPRQAIGECLRIPTVVSMADVYVNRAGFIWNDEVGIIGNLK